MEFSGQVFFDFQSKHVWRIYQTAIRAADTGRVTLALDWRGFAGDESAASDLAGSRRGLAAAAAVRQGSPDASARFIYAMMNLVFQDREDPGADKTLAVAARFAGLDATRVRARAMVPGLALLNESTSFARELGVVGVPTIVRDGPPILITTSGAANSGDPVARIELLDRMLRDDGIWSLTKP